MYSALIVTYSCERSEKNTSASAPSPGRPTVYSTSSPDTAPLPVDIWIEDVQVCSRGAAVPFDEPALARAVARDEVEYTVGLPGEGAETEVFFSDLSHDYVTINAEYTT